MADRSTGRTRYQWGLLLLAAVLLVAWLFVLADHRPRRGSGHRPAERPAGRPARRPAARGGADLDLIDRGVPFAVLLRGEGPDVSGLTSLD